MADNLLDIAKLVDKSKDIIISLSQNPGPDSIAFALCLGLAINQSHKQAIVVCDTPIDFSQYPLKHSDQIVNKIGNKNLVISLKVENQDCVEQVLTNLDEATKTLNLIITPKKGTKPLTGDSVSFSYSGAKADLIFIIGANNFDNLGSLYQMEPSLFINTPTIAVNRLTPSPFATFHLNYPSYTTLSENLLDLLKELKIEVNSDIASNLLSAIDVVTDKLTLPSITPHTFTSIAELIKIGGTRLMLAVNQTETKTSNSNEIPKEWLSPKILQVSKKS